MSEPDFQYPGDVRDLLEELIAAVDHLAWQHEQYEPPDFKPYNPKAVKYHIDQASEYRQKQSRAERLLKLGDEHPMGLMGVLFDLAKNEQQEEQEAVKKQRMAQEVGNVESGS